MSISTACQNILEVPRRGFDNAVGRIREEGFDILFLCCAKCSRNSNTGLVEIIPSLKFVSILFENQGEPGPLQRMKKNTRQPWLFSG